MKRLLEVKQDLLPIIGAGTSVPLGVPNWGELKTRVIDRILGHQDGMYDHRDPQIAFAAAISQDPMGYRAIIQDGLASLEGCSTVLLRALVRLPIATYATTNLDNHLEYALASSGKMLIPTRVGTSDDIPRLRALSKDPHRPVLIKLHGSLGLPATWVMIEAEYHRAYGPESNISNLLSSGHYKPLFIGFSVTDYEIRKAMEYLKRASSEAFAFIRMKADAKGDAVTKELSGLGIRTIPVSDFQEIPELLSLLTDQPPDRAFVSWQTINGVRRISMRLGAMEITSHGGLDAADVDVLIGALENALDYAPARNLFSDATERRTGAKGQYFLDLSRTLGASRNDEYRANVMGFFIEALAFYPDLVTERFLMDLLGNVKEGNGDLLWQTLRILASTYDRLSKANKVSLKASEIVFERILNRLKAILAAPEFADYGFRTRKVIVRYLGQHGAHPSCTMSPPMAEVKIGGQGWSVMVYPICRYQVGKLAEEVGRQTSHSDLERLHPMRPYTLESLRQVQIIISVFGRLTDPPREYTLLTADEWRYLATNGGRTVWPWGDQDPQQGRHATLRYEKKRQLKDQNGNFVEGSSESGLFPAGANGSGISDLIGNVYELTFASDRYREIFHESDGGVDRDLPQLAQLFQICGGAWYFTPSRAREYRVKDLQYNPRFGRNIGMRLAFRS